MKKIAFGFLTVMMLLGGVFLSACGERNISISVSATEVEVYTNNLQEDDFQDITVTLNDSDDGIGVQVDSQNDVVSLTTPTQDRNGDYTFRINALRSGNAVVRVYSIEDPSIYQFINVTSYTYLEELSGLDLNGEYGRSGLFVVKGSSVDLSPENYFNLYPTDANVKDIVWTFADAEDDSQTTLIQNGQVVAEIVDNQTLMVYEECNYSEINLLASFLQNSNVNKPLSLTVLDDSSIISFNIGESNEDVTLIRNDALESTVDGQIVVNTTDSGMTAELVAFIKRGNDLIQLEDSLDYFTVSSMTKTFDNNQMTFNFTIDAQVDSERQKLSGDVYVAFVLKYSQFNYDISTAQSEDDLVLISTYFIPDTLTVRDNTYNSIAGQTIDLYSSYFNSYGYEVLVNVYPDDVILNNSNYQITINDVGGQMTANQNYYLRVYRESDPINPITFERVGTSSTWISEEIANGTRVYLQAGDGAFGTVSNFAINFVAAGNGTATETVYADLYSVTDNPNLDLYELQIDETTGEKVEVGEFDFNQVYYISSSENSMSREFYIRLKGYSTSTGLEPVYNQNSNFSLSVVEDGYYEDLNDPENSYVDLIVTVNIKNEGYEGGFNFSFTHQTGAVSDAISTYAFAPIESAALINNDNGATNVYYQSTGGQDFVISDDGVISDSQYMTQNTLSSLLISAGSNISLGLDYGNATLNITEDTLGYYFAYLDFDAFYNANEDSFNGASQSEIQEIFNNLNPYVDNTYTYDFTTENNSYFTYSNGYLRVASDQGEFVIYVAVIFNGFDEGHNELSLVRVFKLESFYPVTSLRSDVTDSVLYSRESLSSSDESLSYVDVVVSLRVDKNEPTYTDLSNFSISLKNGITNVEADEEEGQTKEVDANGNITRAYLNSNTIENEYVILSGFEIRQLDQTSLGPNALAFRITAKSTQFNSSWDEIINLVYELEYEDALVTTLGTNINIQIVQADRIESVTWVNETSDGEIYLNIATNDPTEQNFTISTSISPDYAENRNLTYYYQAYNSDSSVLDIETVSVSQSFNLTIGNNNQGGYGSLYILPEDMVKTVSGIRQIVYYVLDEDNNLKKEAQYLPLSQIDSYYDALINGTYESKNGLSANYFLNNYNEKVYYEDIILKIGITVADGLSEETAIRVYSQEDLESIQSNLYYRVMNDIEIEDWTSISSFSGMIFGDNEDITLTFTGNSQTFVNNLTGTIKDLTMVGDVVGGGFVANQVSYGATIDNVTVDVNYKDGYYCPSTLTGGYTMTVNGSTYIYAGGIAGVNYGTISNCDVFGLEISLDKNRNGNIAGGIVGLNYYQIRNCGVEFYQFVRSEVIDEVETEVTYNNKFTAHTVGGLVGEGQFSTASGTTTYTQIYNSYVYAYNLLVEDGEEETSDLNEFQVLNGQFAGAFVGSLNAQTTNAFRLENSFAYLGDYNDTDYMGIGSVDESQNGNEGNKIYRNSYITYFEKEGSTSVYRIKMDYILSETTFSSLTSVGTLDYSNIANINYTDLGFDSSVWEIENIDSSINFGFAYLSGLNQNISVSVDQTIQTVDGKTINADYEGVKAGILFLYRVQENVTNSAVQSEINRANTISITDLFGISEGEADSLLLSVDRSNYISFTTNSLTAQRTNIDLGQTIKLTLYSRVDFSQSQTFEIMVLDYIPNLTLTVGNNTIGSGQILNIQTGSVNSRQVQVILDNSVYFNGQQFTLVNNESVDYEVDFDENNTYIDENDQTANYISRYISGNNITFTANDETGVNYVGATISLNLTKLKNNYPEFNDALNSYRQTSFYISSYQGANSVTVDTTSLNITPQESVSFNVTIESDNSEEDLLLTFTYNDRDYYVEDGRVVINDNLVLDVSVPTPTVVDSTTKTYNVIINVNKNYRHRVDANYDFVISVNALSQGSNTTLLKTIDFTVQKQSINTVNVTAYTIDRRVINNSRWYYTPSTTISSTLVPGADSILTLEVSPNFAHFSRIDVNYVASSEGVIGTVGISRLSYNSTYGYYIDSSTTSSLNAGLRVTPTDADLQNGVYYFRIYVSSSFTSNSNVTLTFTFYDDADVVGTYTYNYVIDYLNSAEVLVDGAHSVMLAKGDSAEVSITLELDQSLTNDSIRLENNGDSITLSNLTEEVSDSYRRYTATISTSVLSTLADGNSTGAFYVYASVSRYVNGILDYVESYATVYLVDFTINAEETSVVGSTQQATYNGNTYDAINSYINAEQVLAFDYVIEPETYTFNSENNDEYQAVYGPNGLMAKRTEFIRNGNYRDDVSGYYINYTYNSDTGVYEQLSIEERLYYVNDDGSATAIYNSQTGEFLENSIIEFSSGSNDTLNIKGLRIGSVLLRLTTTVIVGNTTFSYDYDFVIQITIWTDEEVPMPIYTAEEFLIYAQGNPDDQGNTTTADYILMNDIVLENYTPVDTTYFNSFDGNGYQIYIRSFDLTGENSSLNLALFDEVADNSTIKNVRVNLYNAGQLTININDYQYINIAGFALTNNGIIYNCEVVAYYDNNHSTSRVSGSTGIVVNFTRGSGMDNVYLTSSDIEVGNVIISGFVNNNYNIITNSRVGGESVGTIIETDGTNYYSEVTLPTFTIQGQGTVVGFANNNSGTISASFVNSVQINNLMNSTSSITSGFVVSNTGEVHTSYIQGVYSDNTAQQYYYDGSTIQSTGRVAGFVYTNGGIVKNSYVNIAFEVDVTKSYLSAGFVYRNETDGEITLCYAAAKMAQTDINELSFSGVNESGSESLNYGVIDSSYYYNLDRVDTTPQSNYDVGAYSITDVSVEATFYSFSFSSTENVVDGIWTFTDDGVITLTSANHIAYSNRYIVYNSVEEDEYYYLYSILTDIETYVQMDLSYGSYRNPIIIRNAADFAKATGKAQDTEISSYMQYYNDYEVFGNYRLVNDIDFSEIDQNLTGENNIRLTTTSKTFSGNLDGNSFTISNISLGSSTYLENYGLFAELDGAVVMNLGLEVVSVHNRNAQIVGTLAGTAVDSRLIAIQLSPVERRDDEETVQAVSIAGYNIVGGLVGIVMGDSALNDITVTDIDIESTYYYGELKPITRNDRYTGDNLRELVYIGSSLEQMVSTLSYAGGVAGYVDIYTSIGDGYIQYSTQTDVTNYNIVSIKVLNSVDIYGEVAGGLFGYLGKSTMAYDLGLEIDADIALNTTSYITAKNLYAGGIVGESYAGLYAVYAKYSETLQDTIDLGMLSTTATERGQISIFSYSSSDTKHLGRYNNPYYIGGIIGYAGAGYISVGYNRLNVTSNIGNDTINYHTSAIGGIVGLVNSIYSYGADFIETNANVSYYLNEVYFSGVLYSQTEATAGGIIGKIDIDNNVALNKVNSIPYYDSSESFDNVYSLIAGFTDVEDETNYNGETPSNLYLMDERNSFHNVFGTSATSGTARASVAVANQYLVDAKTTADNSDPSTYIYGLTTNEVVSSATGYRPILEIEQPSSYDGSMDRAHSAMASYFLQNNWDDTRWNHPSDKLFPEIVLYPKDEVIYLDADTSVLASKIEEINNRPNATVVVRGRVDEDIVGTYADIDLREYADAFENFSGTMISYQNYMQSNNEGTITAGSEIRDSSEYIIGGYEGDEVGLIISSPIFENPGQGFTLDGVNIYIASEDGEESDLTLSAEGVDTGMIVSGSLTEATFIDLNIFINGNLTIKQNSESMGLIAGTATSTNFQDINFVFRYEDGEGDDVNNPNLNLELHASTATSGSGSSNYRYFGLLAGIITQRNIYNSASISNIVLSSEKKSNGSSVEPDEGVKLEVNISNNNYTDTNGSNAPNSYNSLYFGFLAGQSVVSGTGVLPLTFGITNLIDDTFAGINLTLREEKQTYEGNDITGNPNQALNNLYFGGYFGNANLGAISLVGGEPPTSLIKNFIVHQKITVRNHMAFGLGFGHLEGSGTFSFSINNSSASEESAGVDVSGGLYQFEGFTTGTTRSSSESNNSVNIGGFIGTTNYNISLTSAINVNFDVLGNQPLTIGEGEEETGFDGYDKSTATEDSPSLIYSLYDFYNSNGIWTTSTQSVETEPYVVYGPSNIGAFIGQMTGGNLNITEINIGETCDIQVSNRTELTGNVTDALNETNIGAVGYISGGSVNLGSANKYSAVNYFIETYGTANVGGLVGKATVTRFSSQSYMYNGTVVSFANTLNFGGLAGSVTTSSGGSITNAIYGGTLKNFVKTNDDYVTVDNITVGGVIGTLSVTGTDLSLNSIYSYGDVFVNYANTSSVTLDLSKFAFGGLIGEITSGSVRIASAYSLMTPFNDRMVADGLSGADYRVNAMVGIESGKATFNPDSPSYYSSGVTMSYQYVNDEKNATDTVIDVSYGYNDASYYGYSSKEITNGSGGSSEDTLLSGQISQDNEEDIIGVIKDAISRYPIEESELGSKLNPILVKENGDSVEGEELFKDISSSSDIENMEIKWYYFNDDMTVTTTNTNSLNNVVIVGNGKTITFEDAKTIGTGSKTNISLFKEIGTLDNTYTAISGILVEVEFNYDITDNYTLTLSGLIENLGSSSRIGGSASIMIYAVGVRGSAEFGDTGSVNFGGIVANMYKGMISNSHVDLDIFYHAGADTDTSPGAYLPSSTITAIANVQDGFAEIYNTFAMGEVKSYVPANIYTFNSYSINVESGTETYRTRISNSYTVMQVEVEDYGFGVAYNITNFQAPSTSVANCYYSDYSGLLGTQTTLNGTNWVTSTSKTTLNGTRVTVDNMSIGYNKGNQTYYKINKSSGDIYSPWFYSPYRNYGYGTTGFVYLRNTTTYYRTQTNNNENDDTVPITDIETGESLDKFYAYNTYEYTRLSEEELDTLSGITVNVTIDGAETKMDYFLAISNVGKFRQLQDLTSGNNTRFFLKYDLDIDDLYNNQNGSEEGWNYNQDNNLGSAKNVVVIDGQNHLIEFGATQSVNRGLFGTVYANIENIRIIAYDNITTSNANSGNTYGILAGVYTGRLVNATIQGSINVSGGTNVNYIGGVAGQFTGTLATVENLVDIRVTGGANYIGGIVGQFSSGSVTANLDEETQGKISIVENAISYSSNNGTIVADLSTSQGTVVASDNDDVTGDNQDDDALIYTKNSNGLDLNVSTQHNIYHDSDDDSQGQDKTDGSIKDTTSTLVTVIGGIAGYLSSGKITYSYNNATIMNNYQKTYSGNRQIRNLASGGIAGYSSGEIDNTINTGYIVTGNNMNEGVALSGGIVGYTTKNVSYSYNDAKVQSVSYVNPKYYNITLDNTEIDEETNTGTLKFTIEYNLPNVYVSGQKNDPIDPYKYEMPRLVHAYGIGYFNGGSDNNNANLDSSETINDGNIGYTVRTKEQKYTVQRYAGGDSSILGGGIDGIVETYNYYLNNGKPDIKISAYDSYGFPSRLNYYYTYTIDITGFQHGYSSWSNNNTNPFMKFEITDTHPDVDGDSTAKLTYSEIYNSDVVANYINSLFPGGTSEYYFSIPFYSTDTTKGINDGNSYQELVEDTNSRNSNLNSSNAEGVEHESNFDTLYNNINDLREGKVSVNGTLSSIKVNGKDYTYVSNSSEYITFVGGIGISGSVEIQVPKVSSEYENNLKTGDDDIDIVPVSVSSIKFTMSCTDENNQDLSAALSGITSMGADVEIVVDDDVDSGYSLSYTAYFDKTELTNALGIDQNADINSILAEVTMTAEYGIVYEYTSDISLTKRNLDVYGSTSEGNVKVQIIQSEGGTHQGLELGEFLNNAYSKYYSALKDDGLSFDVYFTNANGVDYYYDTSSNTLEKTGENVSSPLKLNLVKANDAGKNPTLSDDYVGLFNVGSGNQTSFINALTGVNEYTMTLSYYVQGTGSFDHLIGGSTTFEDEHYVEVAFDRKTTILSDTIGAANHWEKYFKRVDNKLTIIGNAFASLVGNSLSGTISFYVPGSGDTEVLIDYINNGSNNYSLKDNYGGSQAEVTYSVSGDSITFKSGGDPSGAYPVKVTLSTAKKNCNSTINIGRTITINGVDYSVTAEYKIDTSAVYDEDGDVIDGFSFENNGDGTYNIVRENSDSVNTSVNIKVKYTLVRDSIQNIEGGYLQAVGVGGNQVVYIINNGFYYTLDEEGNPVNVSVEGQNVQYSEMQDSLGTKYTFYKLSNINSYHGISLDNSKSYIITIVSYNGAASAHIITEEGKLEPIAKFYSLSSSSDEGYEYVMKDEKYYIASYEVDANNNISYQEESDWLDVTDTYGNLERYLQYENVYSINYMPPQDSIGIDLGDNELETGVTFNYNLTIPSGLLSGLNYEFNKVISYQGEENITINIPGFGDLTESYTTLITEKEEISSGNITTNTYSFISNGRKITSFTVNGEVYNYYSSILTVHFGETSTSITFVAREGSDNVYDVYKDEVKVGYIEYTYNNENVPTGGNIYNNSGDDVGDVEVSPYEVVDENGEIITAYNYSYVGLENIVGEIEYFDDSYIEYVITSKSTYENEGTDNERATYYELTIEIPLEFALTNIFNGETSPTLIANNIDDETGETNYDEDIPIITFTTDSLSSYAGVKDLEFNAANYGPTDATENTGLYYGPSYIDFSIDATEFDYTDYANVTLDMTTTNDMFKNGSLTGANGNYSQRISIDVDDTSMAFGDYDNKGNGYSYQFALTIPYSVAFSLNGAEPKASIDVTDLTKVSNGNIIITDNIYVLDMSSTINMEIRGYNHLITEKLSLAVFDYAIKVRESGFIQDLNFAIVADAEANYVDKQNVKVIDVMATKETRVTNVSVYGTVRKIDTVTDKNATGTVYIINISTGAEDVENSNSIDSLLTNLSLIGKDGESNYSVQGTGSINIDGESVNVNLQSYYSATESSSSAIGTNKTILVAGNGGNGSNGADGEISDNTSSPQGENGANGGNGGSGGTTINGGGTESISIDGADGVAGNGGNGADGLNATKFSNAVSVIETFNGLAGGGGSGGNSGTTDESSGKTNRSYEDLPGSGGSGGLGIYYIDNVSNYDEEYYYNYTNGGYNENGYEANPSASDNNNYATWIKSAGGGGTAGDMRIQQENSSGAISNQAGTNGNCIIANTNILRRGYNSYRENMTATSGYYWNYTYGNDGGERLFGNLQMTTTFSYYGTTPNDTGPLGIGGLSNTVSELLLSSYNYIDEGLIQEYYKTELASRIVMEVGNGTIVAGFFFLPWGWVAIGIGAVMDVGAWTAIKSKGSAHVWGSTDENFFELDTSGLTSDALEFILGLIGGVDFTIDRTVFGDGTIYHADGGFGDYWWLYDERNKAAATNQGYDYENRFNRYLDGITEFSKTPSTANNNNHVWEDNFYGGQGGGDGTGEDGNGGTSYTKEIYGYARNDSGRITSSYEVVTTNGYKCFFTRNDYVTSAGIYGDAGHANGGQLETPNFTVS